VVTPSGQSPPHALITSLVFGCVGVVLVVVGVATGSDAVAVTGVAAGSVSLIAALVWREQLIAAWESRRGKRPPE